MKINTIMEVIIAQRVTPIVKCMVLFLLIFTAKVLTSRPQEHPDSKNSIQFGKTPHYVRTFIKYHHRRTIPWEKGDPHYWQSVKHHEKPIGKRSIDEKDFVQDSLDPFQDYTSEGHKDNAIGTTNKKYPESSKDMMNLLTNDVKKQKAKASEDGMITCLYKIHKVAYSVTPSYEEDKNAQMMVENEGFDAPGSISDIVLNGEKVQVEQCSKRGATCYTLWHRSDSGNTTVLGQGCWRQSPQRDKSSCDKCVPATPLLPATKFCCCTTDYCNGDFLSIRQEAAPARAAPPPPAPPGARALALWAPALLVLAALAAAVGGACCRGRRAPSSDHVEKGDTVGSAPEAMATGLLCVDNLTLIEYIGVGKFGTVWRGSLGARPVAVKLYSSAAARHREAAIYTMPQLAHSNILKYYGSDSRPCLTGGGGRQHLTVLELCRGTLRARLQHSCVTWHEFARLAHGVASALAHLHSSTPTKPVIVHRDVNTNNVLISMSGDARLADLGLAQTLRSPNPAKLTEAGTLRYLAPEALEGAIDLSRARAALCAVDVFALGLVLWEMLWRCSGAHADPPAYAAPYQHSGLPARPSHRQMQQLVSRDKVRPPLPRGPSPEPRALRLAADTCDECWDHDAEARLTVVCVQERMSELRQMLSTSGPVLHDNNLRPHLPESAPPAPDNFSNCAAPVSAPASAEPASFVARNRCIERNTNREDMQEAETLIHKSLKDVASPPPLEGPRTINVDEVCLSVARDSRHRVLTHDNSNMNEIRTYPKPLEYVPNDMSVEEVRIKQTNLMQDKKTKWGFRKFFEKKLCRNQKLETEVTLVQENLSNGSGDSGRIRTSIVNDKPLNFSRPSNIALDERIYNLEPPCLSPPNRTLSPTMIMESDMNRENKVFGFKEMPLREDNVQNQIFAVIVPKAKPGEYKRNLVEMRSKTSRGSSESLNKNSVVTSISSQSIFNAGHSESEDSTVKKRLSSDNKICNASNSARSSRASINLELQYIDPNDTFNDSPYELNSDCSSSEDEHLMLLSENDGSKITMQTVTKENTRKHNEVLKEATQTKTADFTFNKSHNKYANFDNEFSDPHDKENVNGYSVDNPVYIAALNGEISTDLKIAATPNSEPTELPKSPKPSLKNLTIKRQHSLEHVSEIFTSSSDITLQNPAGRVKTPGDIPVAVRKARRDRALQRSRVDANRLSLYDDRMMFGNSL